jgi:hypothetical protein
MVQLQVALRPTCEEKETDSPRAAAAMGMAHPLMTVGMLS